MNLLRFVLFFLVPTIAVISLLVTELQREIIHTKDWHDVTILGRGYITTVDEYNENRIWLRSIRMEIDDNWHLCAVVNGKLRPIEPPIQVPSDWRKIDIDHMGIVQVTRTSGSTETCGAMALSTFTEAEDEEIVFEKEGRAPLLDIPGINQGFVMPGTRLAYVLPLTLKTTSTILGFSAWILFVFLYFRRSNKIDRSGDGHDTAA